MNGFLKKGRKNAFTLIELLIVVAIIAILAAIAVPNFLEAQTRAKVSRMKADMRSIGTAVESYRVDNVAYPIPADEEGRTLAPGTGAEFTEWFEARIPMSITTPISYMSAIPSDIFAGQDGELPLIHYSTAAYVQLTEGDTEEYEELIKEVIGDQKKVAYFLLSHGPDLDHDFAALGHAHEEEEHEEEDDEEDEHHAEDGDYAALYDPTNGTMSNGDVVFWGGGVGYRD